MSICAVYLQKSSLERYSGITVNCRLIWEEELICCTAFSGGLQQLYGLRKHILFFLV